MICVDDNVDDDVVDGEETAVVLAAVLLVVVAIVVVVVGVVGVVVDSSGFGVDTNGGLVPKKSDVCTLADVARKVAVVSTMDGVCVTKVVVEAVLVESVDEEVSDTGISDVNTTVERRTEFEVAPGAVVDSFTAGEPVTMVTDPVVDDTTVTKPVVSRRVDEVDDRRAVVGDSVLGDKV